MKENLYQYILEIADNCLILGQRLGELCGHGPNLETDIACTNISLDLLGQVRSYYQYAAQVMEDGRTEDDIAFMRMEREYRNTLLVEQPNTDFAFIISRQFMFDLYHYLFLKELQHSRDLSLSAIASKSIKEVSYHLRFSSDWMKRLGDGTEESQRRMQAAINTLWPYFEELFEISDAGKALIKEGIAVDTKGLKKDYLNSAREYLQEANLIMPEVEHFMKGGKSGVHSEHMGYILADLQYMQRAYPNMNW
ncbi:MAG: phenylacetate-CoA oxygenase subunit PaaC [Flavobacteriaceae bacterium]|nr:phenylacetate-CoA oxygenase subunit PaaC [Bacteroidia bacterium]NNK69346.1 phenylacetate-CoA oxygenase subunit PaaC [Flavobacteriaceae bacterium]NNL81085.1 phenylacetate-CoA oxygenase subunit PaaC [Flavobacteriaceae bacterium]